MKQLIFMVAIFLLTATLSPAATVPMVQRHLFTPAPEADVAVTGPRSVEAEKLEKQFLFTGVIISGKHKWAFIQEHKLKRGQEKGPQRYREGDEITGYRIKTIGNNYLVLAHGGKTVRLDLYRGEKKRPTPPPIPQLPGVASSVVGAPAAAPRTTKPKGGGQKASVKGLRPPVRKGAAPPAPRQGQGAKTTEKSTASKASPAASGTNNSFAEAIKSAIEAQQHGQGQAASTGRNPFLEAIERARGY